MMPTAPPCLPPREVTRPKVPPPPDACDTHAHVFGPAALFPYADDRSYTPPDAPLEKYLGMLDAIGFARGVLVQGSAHGHDNSAMLDALERQPDRLRGVAVADAAFRRPTTRLESIGVRGLRFNHFFATGNCIIAAACRCRRPRCLPPDGRSRLASAALDRCEGFAGDHSDAEVAGATRGDRPYGPHRRPRRHATAGFQSLLRAVGEGWCWVKLSGAHRIQPTGARLSRRPAVSRGAG